MIAIKRAWEETVREAVRQYARSIGISEEAAAAVVLIMQEPPKPELGDFAVPMFPLARVFRQSPQLIAEKTAAIAQDLKNRSAGTVQAEGPYVNMFADLGPEAAAVYSQMADSNGVYGRGDLLAGQKVMIEFSCPNTNKPLHLGHLRNDSIGMSTARILEANGAEVRRVNLINDRGVHICKSMLAYQRFGNGETPQDAGLKSDHFVGSYYVRYNTWAKECKGAEKEAQQLLVKWEQGDRETVDLWQTLNRWAIDGIFETYEKTGVEFDDIYYESTTYQLGRDLVMQGLEQGVFYREEDGSVWISLEDIGLDKKVLLRGDGTTLYLTQDLGTAVSRHKDWPFDQLIYVVGSEQQYHFKVLFHVLSRLGYSWSENLYHLSYGMVNLPEGKMKSREGTVVDADDLLTALSELAKAEIIEKGREGEIEDIDATASAVALAALNYYLLQVHPAKDMIFNPAESIAFNGNTGPYLQYMGARISSMLRKFDQEYAEGDEDGFPFNPSLLTLTEEHQLLKMVLQYPLIVRQAGEEMNPTVLAGFLYEISRQYSRYYHDHQILRCGSKELMYARVGLSRMVLQVLKNGFSLIGVPFLAKM